MPATEANNPLDLSKIPDQEILIRMQKLSRTERKIIHLVLWHINEVEIRKLYLQLHFDSLYKYLTQHLGYSEDSAYDHIQASRVLRNNPRIATKLECGTLKLSQLVKVEQSLKQEKKSGKTISPEITGNLLEKLENKTVFETEKILACELNQAPRTTQKIKPQKDNSVRIETTLNQEQHEILKKAQGASFPTQFWAITLPRPSPSWLKAIFGKSKAKNLPMTMSNLPARQRKASGKTRKKHIAEEKENTSQSLSAGQSSAKPITAVNMSTPTQDKSARAITSCNSITSSRLLAAEPTTSPT
jgi:hypothetical protein